MIAAVVLAAGGASRFHGASHKLLSSFRGRPLVSWAIGEALAAGLDETAVVSGAVDLSPAVGEGAVVLHNPDWAEGMATSIWTGLRWCAARGHEIAVIGLGDQPLVPSSAWRAVADADHRLAVATFAGQRRPPVRIAEELWGALPSTGDIGARQLIAARPDLVHEVACEGQGLDIDTEDDLSTWS